MTDSTPRPIPASAFLPCPLPGRIRVPLMTPVWRAAEFAALAQGLIRTNDAAEQAGRRLAGLVGVKHGLALASGRSALQLGLQALDLAPGEIIVPACICRSVIQAVLQAGLTPVLADVDESYNLDPTSAAEAISPQTKAILVAHMFGQPAPMAALSRLTDEHGLALVDDAAMSLGARAEGRPVGSWGEFGFISLSQGKTIVAAGGGILLTDSDRIAAYAQKAAGPPEGRSWMARRALYFLAYHRFKRYLSPLAALRRKVDDSRSVSVAELYRLQDRIPDEYEAGGDIPADYLDPTRSGLHFTPRRMTSLQARLTLAQLGRLPEIIDRTRSNAALYRRELADTPGLDLPPQGRAGATDVYFPIFVRATSRYELAQHLADQGIETQWSYFPIHLQARFRHLRRTALPKAEALWPRLLYLPVGAHVTPGQVSFVAGAIKNRLGGRASRQEKR